MITPSDYQTAVSRTMNSTATPSERLCNWGLGLAGEAGEVVEHLKKHVFHGRPLDNDAVKKELGDVLWYVAAVANDLGISIEDIMLANIKKLEARYPDGFKRAVQ